MLEDLNSERIKCNHAQSNGQRHELLANEWNEQYEYELATLKSDSANQKSHVMQLESANERLVKRNSELEDQTAELAFLVAETNLERDEAKRKVTVLKGQHL